MSKGEIEGGKRCLDDRQRLAYGDEPVADDFAATLRRLREARNWTVGTLARKVPCSTSHVSRMENRKGFASRDIAQHLDDVLEADGSLFARYRTQCPYPGMEHFRPAQTDWFLGRDSTTRDLIEQLLERAADSGPLAVIAPSGAGKSSLLRAGLLGQVLKGAVPGCDPRRTALMTPTGKPLDELDAAMAAVTGQGPEPANCLLVIDQFEELFQPDVPEDVRRRFLHTLCDSTAQVVIGIRADFYPHCLEYPELRSCLRKHFPLGPMNEAELRKAIEEPARRAGRRIGPGLTELLLSELSAVGGGAEGAAYQPGALPLLSHALRAAWEKEQSAAADTAKDITIADYRATGGVAGAVRTTAEEVYHRLPDEHHRLIARQLLVRLVHFGADSDGTRRRVTWRRLLPQLPGTEAQARTVLDAFCEARLLTMDRTKPPGDAIPRQRDGSPANSESTVEVTHEALLGAWPELAEWLRSEQDDQKEFRNLAQAADAWHQAKEHREDLLLVGTRLSLAEGLLEKRPDEAADLHREYVRASVVRRESTARRRRRLRRALALLAVLSLVLALVVGQRLLNERSRQAVFDAERLAEQSQALAQAVWPDDAARLAVASHDSAHTPNSLSALLSTQSHRMVGRLDVHAPGYAVALGPDGNRLLVGTGKGAALWSLADRRLLKPLPSLGGGAVHAVAYSHHGSYLAVGDDQGNVGLYTADGRRLLARPPRHPGKLWSLAFDRDDKLLASGDDQGCARVWDIAHGREQGTLIPQSHDGGSDIWSLAFSPVAQTLAVAQEGRPVRLLDPVSGKEQHSFGDRSASFRSVDFSKDGSTLGAAAFNDKPPLGRVWNIGTGAGHQLAGHTDSLYALAFGGANGLVATGGQDNNARLWDSATGAPVATLAGHAGNIRGLAFSHDGTRLATINEDHTVGLWDTTESGTTAVPAHPTQLMALAVQPHGTLLATGGADGTVSLWDRRSLALRRTLRMGHDAVAAVAFSPDGSRLAAADKGRTVTTWDSASGTQRPLHQLPVADREPLSALAWSPDGRSIATGDDRGRVLLWDPDDRTTPRDLVAGQADSVRAVAFDPSTGQLAEGGQLNVAHLREVPGGNVRRTFPGHTDSVFSIAFSSDGRLMATAGRDDTLRLWDPRTGHPVRVLVGHSAALKSVAFSPDNKALLTASSDGTVRIWRFTGDGWQSDAVLSGSTGTVWGAVFDPDDPQVIYSAGEDSALRRWSTDADSVKRRICSALGHGERARWKQVEIPVDVSMPCRGSRY